VIGDESEGGDCDEAICARYEDIAMQTLQRL